MDRAYLGAADAASCSRPNVPFQPRSRLVKGCRPGRREEQCRPSGRRHTQGSRPAPPCKVTNTGEEMRDPETWANFDPDIIEVDQHQIPEPELGPLERRVESTFEEALFSDDISLADTEYWFTEPPGGWNQEKKILRKATVIPNEDASAKHFGEGRLASTDLQEGQELTGTISRCMLYHGAQIDIGADYDALVPIKEEHWVEEVHEAMQLFTEVRVKVHKIVQSPICRFPIIVELVSPDLEGLLPDVSDYQPVFNLCGQSDIEVAKELTGREYTPTKYWLDTTPDSGDRKIMAVNDAEEQDEARDVSESTSPMLLSRIRDLAIAR
ncbi:TPA: hypothetical protein ACH3X2_011808 [Trebouxia sp. C0005]